MSPDRKPISPKPDPEGEKRRQEQIRRQMRYSVTYILVGFLVLWLFQQVPGWGR